MPNQSDPTQPNVPTPPAVAPPMDLPPLPQEFPGAQQNIQPPIPPAPSVDQGSAAPPETPPVTSNTPKKKFGAGRIIATILGVLVLVGGVGAGYLLTQQPQLFQQLAYKGCGGCPAGTSCNGQTGQCEGGGGSGGGSGGSSSGQSACQQCQANNSPSECTAICGGGGIQINGGGSGGSGGSGGGSTTCTPSCSSKSCGDPNGCGGSCAYGSGCTISTSACLACEQANSPSECVAICGTGSGGGGNLGGAGNGGEGFGCIDNSVCANGYTCVNGKCTGNTNTVSCGRDADTNAPVCCAAGTTAASCTAAGGQAVCEPGTGGTGRQECVNGGTHCTIKTNEATCAGANTTTTTNQTTTVPACLNVTAYGADWTALTDAELSKLAADTAVNFCVTGANATFDKAMFKINSTTEPETTTKGQGAAAAAYCQSYTITAADIGTTVHVLAKIHDSTSSTWIGESF